MKKNYQLLNFLGRGGAFNPKEGSNSAFLIENNNLFLIDCGEDSFSKLLKHKLLDNIESIHIFITHLHSDHYGSLSTLIYYCYYVKNLNPHIYSIHPELQDILKINGHSEKEYSLINTDIANTKYPFDGLSILPYKVNHKSTMNSYGLLLNYKNHKIYYSGDSNHIIAEAIQAIRDNEKVQYYQDTSTFNTPPHLNINTLIENTTSEDRNHIYCMHIDNEDIFDIASNNNLNIVETLDHGFRSIYSDISSFKLF